MAGGLSKYFVPLAFCGLFSAGSPNVAFSEMADQGGSTAPEGDGSPSAAAPAVLGFCLGSCDAPPPPPPCELAEATAELCGKPVTYYKFCPVEGPPKITGPMLSEAENHPEIQGVEEEMFSCVNYREGDKCKAHDTRESDGSASKELTDYSVRNSPAQQIKFHAEVTDSPITDARNAGALVSHKGFSREPEKAYFLYTSFDDRKFFENAEGIALVNKGVVEKEKAAQLALADALSGMKDTFDKNHDQESAKNTELYKKVALGRAALMDALRCDLKQKAAINRDRENRMASLTESSAGGVGNGSGTPLSHEQSDITGINDLAPQLAEGETAKVVPPFDPGTPSEPIAQEEVLAVYSGYKFTLEKKGEQNPEADLFTRVHAKYQQLESHGKLYRTILDGEPKAVLP